MVALDDVRYIVDENLLSLGNGMVVLRRDTARFSRPPVEELLPLGISDPQWIPIVGDRGWVIITSDRRLRTRPGEAELAITHKLKVVHLHGAIGTKPAWDQLVELLRGGAASRVTWNAPLRGHGGFRCKVVVSPCCSSRRASRNASPLGPRAGVHPAARPPRLSTAAAHPAPEPHGEEPPPIAARSRWRRQPER
jgi:hypothetical protein